MSSFARIPFPESKKLWNNKRLLLYVEELTQNMSLWSHITKHYGWKHVEHRGLIQMDAFKWIDIFSCVRKYMNCCFTCCAARFHPLSVCLTSSNQCFTWPCVSRVNQLPTTGVLQDQAVSLEAVLHWYGQNLEWKIWWTNCPEKLLTAHTVQGGTKHEGTVPLGL